MVDVKDLLQMSYYELAPFTGSDGDKRFRIEKKLSDDDSGEKLLMVSLWFGKFSYDNTSKDDIITHTEAFSYDGLSAIADWINSTNR